MDEIEQPPQGSAPAENAVPPSWTEQDSVLRGYWHELKSPEEIAEILGRSVAAVMTRAARLGLPRRSAPGRKRGYKRTDVLSKPKTSRAKTMRERSVGLADYDEPENPSYEVKSRVCLMCLKKFESQGRHNRICSSCKGSADFVRGSSTPDFSF